MNTILIAWELENAKSFCSCVLLHAVRSIVEKVDQISRIFI